MKIYIWFDVSGLTYHYHDNGGLVIIAPSLEKAREFFLVEHPEQAECEMLTIEPDEVLDLKDEITSRVYRFQDAGCC